jgi:hypothetical protein
VTLEALLTFIGILVGVLAIARPVQRRSLTLFVPLWVLPVAIGLSLLLLIFRDAPFGVVPPFGWPLSLVLYGLTLGAFLIPVGAAVWGWFSWYRARLSGNRMRRVEGVFQTALREREFDEVERILRRNEQTLDRLPPSAATVLFRPAMVKALVDSYSMMHLELLANMKFLRSLENRFGAVEVVVRELLRCDSSPLLAAVVERYGGVEHLVYSDSERRLIEKTFENPEWYVAANAHYPLIMAAMEQLRSGELDVRYNGVDRDYEATQGISSRSTCAIYLAVKTEVIAIETALGKRVEADFYISDLSQIFGAVLERSKFAEDVWESPLSNSEFPTPYAYLLYEIASDLRALSAKALRSATRDGEPPVVGAPGRVARDLAQSWSFCIWNIAESEGWVSPAFRKDAIGQYLVFILELHGEPSEIYAGPVEIATKDLVSWRDLFLSELQQRMAGNARRGDAIREAFDSLDRGKMYVFHGYEWLGGELFGDRTICIKPNGVPSVPPVGRRN